MFEAPLHAYAPTHKKNARTHKRVSALTDMRAQTHTKIQKREIQTRALRMTGGEYDEYAFQIDICCLHSWYQRPVRYANNTHTHHSHNQKTTCTHKHYTDTTQTANTPTRSHATTRTRIHYTLKLTSQI